MEYLEKLWPDLSRQEAEAYLGRFLREQPERLERLVQTCESTGGPTAEELDYSPSSLVPLWHWVRERLSWNEAYEPPAVLGDPPVHVPTREDLPPPGEIPSWAGAHPREAARFSPDTLWLIDMVARYFAEVLCRANPQAEWRVGNSRIKGYAEQNRPVLAWAGGDLNPTNLMTVLASRELRGDPRVRGGESLRDLFDVQMEPVVRDAVPGRHADLDLFDVDEYDPEGEWTYDIYLDDWFAAVGEDQVARLIADLSADARIVEVHHEDREHLLVNAPDLTLGVLEELVGAWFERHEDEIREAIDID